MTYATKNNKCKYGFLLLHLLFAIQLVDANRDQQNNEGEFVTVTLSGCHRIRGRTQQTIYANRTFVAFKGIPYAEPPVGQLRFKVSICVYMSNAKTSRVSHYTKIIVQCEYIGP